MNTTALRTLGSSLMVLAFVLAPVAPVFESSAVKPEVKVAEAAPISYGTISGIVKLASSTNVVSDVEINLYLKNSDSLYSSVKTDANGIFAFSVPQGVDYRVSISPALGYGIPTNSATSSDVVSLGNSSASIEFTVSKLPYIKMFGAEEITIQKGTEFKDPGVIFQTDDATPVRGYAIESNGKVDINTVGKYKIEYTISKDATNGYPILPSIRTINVVDKNVGLTVVVKANPTSIVVDATKKDCIYLNSYLGKSFSNDKLEVLKLQAFLFFREGYVNVRATGVFDAATEIAVRNFQDKYFTDILTPWGTEDNTGEVRMLTLKKINDISCGTKTVLNDDQAKTLAVYKAEVNAASKTAVVKEELPVIVATEPKSMGSKISSWWSGVKKSLIAAFPSFSKEKKEDNSSTTPTEKTDVKKGGDSAASLIEKTDSVSEDKVVDGDDNLATAKESKESKMSIWATIISALLGLVAFSLAFFIYRKTRAPIEVEVVSEVPRGKVSPK